MNLLPSKSIRRGSRSTVAALTLLAASITTAQAAVDNYGISNTWFEGGWSRMNDRIGGSYDIDGGYLRGSFALGDSFYLLGGYSRNQDTVSETIGTNTVKMKWTYSLGELGLGFHIPLAERLDFIGELSGLYFDYDNKTYINGQRMRSIRLKDDHNYAGKAMLGLRAKPFEMLDVWAKAGYFKMQDADNSIFPVRKSALANVGVQLQLTPNFGVVGEADFYKKDYRYYRAGVRVSF